MMATTKQIPQFSKIYRKNVKITEFLNKMKQSTSSSNGTSNGFFNKTVTIRSSLATSKTHIPVEVIDEKRENPIVDEEEIELPEYEKVKIVGRGSFGVAILYVKKSNRSQVVLKQINLINLTKMEKELAMNEVDVFSKLHHPNIICYLGSFIRGNVLLIEMEYANGGTLAQILSQKEQHDYMPERYILTIFEQITSAINYMHAENIMHRDLKTANVFLSSKGTVKIGDFGISKIMNTKIHAQTVLGTPYYFSPEMLYLLCLFNWVHKDCHFSPLDEKIIFAPQTSKVFWCEGKDYDNKSDIWALGCVLGEMCCLQKAFAATNLSELVAKIMSAQYIPLPSTYSEGLKSLISQLLKVEPNQRPSASEVLQYWIPLVFRNLGKNKGYEFKSSDQLSESYRSVLSVETSGKDFANKQYMEASTATISESRTERSVLYQLSSFGTNTVLNPLQLPSNIKIHCVATNASHFLVVTTGGLVYSWGEGNSGQLGYGNIGIWKHYPSCVDSLKKYKIINACAGEGFSVFLSDLGVVFTVGDNSKGALGHNDMKYYLHCRPLDRLNEVNIVLIACGSHHVVVVSRENGVFSWGTCKYGALGLGNQIFSSFPTHVQSTLFGTKVVKIACSQNCTLLLLESGEVLAAGRNNDNKLGLGEKVLQSMFFRKITDIDKKVLDVAVSTNHSIFLIEGGYVLTIGKNSNGQRGLGHCNHIGIPTLVTGIKDKYIKRVQCSVAYSVVFSDDNVITLWGTRSGIPDKNEDSSRIDNSRSLDKSEKPKSFELGNSTAAFTNFLASVYKSELILDPIDILAVFSSEEQISKGYYINIVDIYPLHHSILVLVHTTTPLATNNV